MWSTKQNLYINIYAYINLYLNDHYYCFRVSRTWKKEDKLYATNFFMKEWSFKIELKRDTKVELEGVTRTFLKLGKS